MEMNSPTSLGLLYFTERGSGPLLLLVHGLGMSGDMFEPVVEPLAKRHRLRTGLFSSDLMWAFRA